MKKKIVLFLRQFHENCRSKTTSCRKLSNFSEMQDDALRHREDLTLSILNLQLSSLPPQAANCCRNSRLAVDEDDLMWFKI